MLLSKSTLSHPQSKLEYVMARQNKSRRLLVESLEGRSLMAADCHNLFAPFDVNDDSIVTPADALKVINQLNRGANAAISNPIDAGFVDVTDDGNITPSDALRVINWLNQRDPASNGNESTWTKVDGSGDERVGVRLIKNEDGSTDLEVRIQNAAANDSHEVLLQDKWIGTIQTDDRGRGVLKLDGNNDLVSRIPELLMEGQVGSTLVVESVAEVSLTGEGERTTARAAENRKLIANSVFSSPLTFNGERRGEVLYASHGNVSFLGVYARGLTADQSYDVTIAGTVVASFTANSAGVIAKRIDVKSIENFPTIESNTTITVGEYTGAFQTLKDRAQIPDSVYLANLSGNRMLGGAQLGIGEDRTVIRLLLGRVEKNSTFDLKIDGIKIAEVTSNRRGLIEYHFDSRNGGTLLAELPPLTADSVISVGNIASGKLVKLGRK